MRCCSLPLRAALRLRVEVQPRRAASAQRCHAARCCVVAANASLSRTPLVDQLPDAQRRQVDAYVRLLLSWNTKLNLVAASQATTEQIMTRHVEDALALLPCIDAAVGKPDVPLRLVDVGSGAGFPGMVLAIARPDWQVVLVESLTKRVKFLNDVIQRAPVPNARTFRARAEDAGHDAGLREQCDVAVARAVAEMRVLAELCLPLVRVGGVLVAQKGADPEQEVTDARRAVSLLGGGALSIQRVATLGPDGRPFTAVICPKQRPCVAAYPREAGTPKKEPL